MKNKEIEHSFSSFNSVFIIAGPCVIESRDHTLKMAAELSKISERVGVPIIFKSSFDKANRSSITSYRGVDIYTGLDILSDVKEKTGLPILTDIHNEFQAPIVGEIVDIIQIPAFLSRQTDIIVAAAKTGKTINLKKGQFLSPWDMKNVIEKADDAGCKEILVTERGTQFGYNNLVSDMRSIPIMQEFGHPVIFDATHSNQLPGKGGMREMIPSLAKAAMAVGADGLFFEVHDDPDNAMSDASTQWPLHKFEKLLKQLMRIHNARNEN
jgi:2-dehydro-3-deoxyphosphooctonate aldolase (KDO 8-P synthase)